MLLPARMAVLNHLSKVESASADDIMLSLKPKYGNERQFNHEAYVEHLMALEANGLVSLVNYELKDDGNLKMFYKITEDGMLSVKKYIPQKIR